MSREKPDFYALKAQKEGYPARSVYKLEEIHQKFNVLRRGGRHLDVGSSPGSWSLYTLKFLKGSGFVVGFDLTPPASQEFPPNAYFFQGDLFDPQTQAEVQSRGPYDVILSDAAPLTTGNRTVDTGRSFNICEQVIELSKVLLKQNGNLVVKIFQGGDERVLAERMRELFAQVKTLRPQAVRKESFETYLIGLGKKHDL